MTLVWSAEAINNLIDHLTFIRLDNPTAAGRIASEIQRQTNLLQDFPELGRSGRVGGTRELAIDRTPYIAVYRIHSQTVEIVRLLHGAQDFY